MPFLRREKEQLTLPLLGCAPVNSSILRLGGRAPGFDPEDMAPAYNNGSDRPLDCIHYLTHYREKIVENAIFIYG
jgi:hypothetical protein